MTKIPSIEETAKAIIEKVQHYATCHPYPNNSAVAKAYLEGINTAMAMLYIDLTGTPKVKGFLTTYAEVQRTALLTELRESIQTINLYDWNDQTQAMIKEEIKAHINKLINPTKLWHH